MLGELGSGRTSVVKWVGVVFYGWFFWEVHSFIHSFIRSFIRCCCRSILASDKKSRSTVNYESTSLTIRMMKKEKETRAYNNIDLFLFVAIVMIVCRRLALSSAAGIVIVVVVAQSVSIVVGFSSRLGLRDVASVLCDRQHHRRHCVWHVVAHCSGAPSFLAHLGTFACLFVAVVVVIVIVIVIVFVVSIGACSCSHGAGAVVWHARRHDECTRSRCGVRQSLCWRVRCSCTMFCFVSLCSLFPRSGVLFKLVTHIADVDARSAASAVALREALQS